MAKRKRVKPPEDEHMGFNMTPMIDIVFQLLVFFMLVLDMSKHVLEPLILPYASKAIKEKHQDPQTLILNILINGTIKINGEVYWRPEFGDNIDTLIAVFDNRRRQREYQEVPGNDNWVSYPVLLRADRSTPFEHLQKILMVATKFGGVTRVQLAAKQED